MDADALPDALKKQIKAGKVDLDDPATTIALLKLNAVVGVTAFANPDGSVKSMGIQCAFCHSTVDDSFAPGIGKRLDGWAEPRPERRRDRLACARTSSRSPICSASTWQP